jgi:hypothetical protein
MLWDKQCCGTIAEFGAGDFWPGGRCGAGGVACDGVDGAESCPGAVERIFHCAVRGGSWVCGWICAAAARLGGVGAGGESAMDMVALCRPAGGGFCGGISARSAVAGVAVGLNRRRADCGGLFDAELARLWASAAACAVCAGGLLAAGRHAAAVFADASG